MNNSNRREVSPSLSNNTPKNFGEMCAAYYKELNGYAIKLCCKTSIDPEDLVQNTITRALEHADKFMPGTNLRAWLHKICFNLFVNEYRRTATNRVNFTDPTLNTITNYAAEETDPTLEQISQFVAQVRQIEGVTEKTAAEVATQIVNRYLQIMTTNLNDEFVDSIQMSDPIQMAYNILFSLEFPYKEIAQIFQVPVGTVMSRIFRGRQAFIKLSQITKGIEEKRRGFNEALLVYFQ